MTSLPGKQPARGTTGYTKASTQPAGAVISFLLIATLSLGACSSPAPDPPHLPELPRMLEPGQLKPLSGERPLRVVASTSMIADIAANIGGDAINLFVLIPSGIDPHTYQPTPGDIQKLYQADLVLLNGIGLEATLTDVLTPVSAQVPVISLSDSLPARILDDDGHPEADDHLAGLDPHVWLDPLLVLHWVDRIELAFTTLDPAQAEGYQEQAAAYRALLGDLHSWIQSQVAEIPLARRKLVLDHLSFGYFSERYGFEMIGALVPAFSSSAEPSARDLTRIMEAIQSEDVPAIFVEVGAPLDVPAQIAHDLGIQVIHLYVGSLGPPGAEADTYLELMQYNVLAIRHALAPE